MTLQSSLQIIPTYRRAGRIAIVSGIVGILSYGFLLTAVLTRSSWVISRFVELMFRAHDVGVSIQFLLLIPVTVGLYKLAQLQPPGMSRTRLRVGIASLLLTALFLLLGLGKVVSDGFYTVPQGIFGVWLIAVNWRMPGLLPRWLRWFGMVVGLGLLIVGSFFPGYAIFVDTVILQIPAVDLTNYPPPPMNLANTILHQLIWIGSIMGVATLPVWTILLGTRLLRGIDNTKTV